MQIYNIMGLNGNPIRNQFVIEIGRKTYFQSYDSVVACVDDGGDITLSTNWSYSRTTMKYLTLFLRYNNFSYKTKKDVEKAINNGKIHVANKESLVII